MSDFKVFMTGATGYIGGDLLYLIQQCHPAWQISCLVRDTHKASKLITSYPRIRVVFGDLDSADLLEEEAASANIVYHCANSDHRRSALAISKGLARNPTKTVFWVHTSGAGILTHRNFATDNFESTPPDVKIYDDWEGVGELTSLPEKALHRHVDKIVLATSTNCENHIKTAIVCPPVIYGLGRGVGNVRSVQINMAIQLTLRNGKALRMGDGTNIWHGVHIRDLSQLYLLLGQAAINGEEKATWNGTGYYLAENDIFRWGDVMQNIADECQRRGYLATNEVQSVDFEQAQKHHKLFPYLCGTTSRGIAKRARRLLGWKPKQKSLSEELPSIIEDEARAVRRSSQKKVGLM